MTEITEEELNYEPFVTKTLIKYTKSGHIAFDIGANTGTITGIFAKLVGEDGSVYSFEPNPNNFSLLQSKFANNPNVLICQEALSDENSSHVNFYLDKRQNLSGVASSLYRLEDMTDNDVEVIKINTVTLDDYFKQGIRPNIIKIDVEGAEPRVIKGGRDTILSCRPIIIFEFWETWWEKGFREMFKWLDQIGVIFRIKLA